MQDDVDLAWECGVQTSCMSPLGSVDHEAFCTRWYNKSILAVLLKDYYFHDWETRPHPKDKP